VQTLRENEDAQVAEEVYPSRESRACDANQDNPPCDGIAVRTQFLKRLWPTRFVRLVQAQVFEELKLKWTFVSGIKVQVLSRADWTLYNDIFVEGEYDPALAALVHNLLGESKAVVVDLGANVGFFSLRLFHVFALRSISPGRLQIFAVEPSSANLRDLERRLQDQAEWNRCVSIVPGLVGEKRTGSAQLFESHNHHMTTLVEAMKYPGASRTGASFVDLDQVLPRDVPIDLLKCDIEGAEVAFVRNYVSLLSRVRIAIFEVHHNVCEVGELRQALESAGLTQERVLVDRGNTSVRMYSQDS